MERRLGWLAAAMLATALPVVADDRFDRPGRGWEQPRWRQHSYDYDPRSPYSQHPIYPREYRRDAPILRRHDLRERHLERRQHWHDHREPRRGYYPRYRQDYRQAPPSGFYYGPYRSYPSYPAYRFYRQ